MDAFFCVAKEAALVLPNKRLQNSEDFRRNKLHSLPFLFVIYFGSNESLYSNCYLQGPGSNIVDFAIKLTTSGVSKVWLASHKQFFDPGDVVLQLFVRNTEDLFCFAIALTPPLSDFQLLCNRRLVFCSFIPHLHLLWG